MTAPLLLTENLTVTYGRRGRQVRAVRGVSLHVDRGETVAIVGESGSGKSSLVNALLGLTPSRTVEVTGRACIADTEVTGIDERALSRVRGKRVGYIPQDPAAGLNPARRVAAQLADAVTVHDRDQDRAALRVRIGEALAEVGLADVDRIARAYPHELSGGQRQRVLIAMALINSPELVVADEPTSALDVTTQKAILDRLAELRRDRHLGLLLVTHDLGVAHERADRIFVMREGLLVSHGTPDDITSSSEPYTRALVDSAPSITSPRLRPATAIATLNVPWPSAVTTVIASSNPGTARNTSTTRMIAASTGPPANPLISPIAAPMEPPTVTAKPVASSVVRVPAITRLRMSRPSRSVPKGCAQLGGSRPHEASPVSGS